MEGTILVYAKLLAYSLIPVAFSLGFYIIKKKTAFSRLSPLLSQVIIGVIFGGVSVLCSEFGVDVGEAAANVRDAAPMCAGFIFGPWAGIIAGTIGGIERWFAIYWGGGVYSRIACSVSTVISGFYAAALRKFMLDNKRPSWIFGLVSGAVMEIIHMTALFFTHLEDSDKAFEIVKITTFPMCLANGVSVMLSLALVEMFYSGVTKKKNRYRRISQQVQLPLLIVVVLGFFTSTMFVYNLQTNRSVTYADSILKSNLSDLESDISDEADENILTIAHAIADNLNENPDADLNELAEQYGAAVAYIIDENGIVAVATDGQTGYDMASDKDLPEKQRQSSDFLVLLDGETDEYVQPYKALAADHSVKMKLAGVSLDRGGFVQVGLDGDALQEDIDSQIKILTNNWHIGKEGYFIIADRSMTILNEDEDFEGRSLSDIGLDISDEYKTDTRYKATINGEACYFNYSICEGYYVFGILSEDEVFETRDALSYINGYMEILIFAAMFVVIYLIIKKIVVDKIRSVNDKLGRIIDGNLDTVVDVRSSQEFVSLSDDINSTVDTLKHYIEEAAGRIDKELAFAKEIQQTSLPSVFPPYPGVKDFDIYASMNTAKEVGGDFYDFYFVGDSRFAFLIADVSGKGIPAAMFMMKAKSVIKSFAEAGLPADEIFTKANEELCDGNDAGMFVTAWLAIIDLKTGHVSIANAGHNPPLLCRKGGEYEYLSLRPGFVLAGMEGIKYREQTIDLNPGDTLYLYTDGVTEATDVNNSLYGEARLKETLNKNTDCDLESVINAVSSDIDTYAGEAEQADDITMLMFRFNGRADTEDGQ